MPRMIGDPPPMSNACHQGTHRGCKGTVSGHAVGENWPCPCDCHKATEAGQPKG